MKGRHVASPQICLSAYGRRRARDARNRRAGKQLTCTFSLKEQLAGQSVGKRAVCVPYTGCVIYRKRTRRNSIGDNKMKEIIVVKCNVCNLHTAARTSYFSLQLNLILLELHGGRRRKFNVSVALKDARNRHCRRQLQEFSHFQSLYPLPCGVIFSKSQNLPSVARQRRYLKSIFKVEERRENRIWPRDAPDSSLSRDKLFGKFAGNSSSR
ncbi:hypothetical protein PUN28_001150 [Cardiocondyla obscurior]|uniref:Uncharacterized protein n=1 Tax=Cardiocondyla obscurior TaxID=286306 RepID=A0AAW2H3B9_9HYME